METENETGLKSILNKYYESIEQLKKILPEKEYRKAFAILTVHLLIEIYEEKKIHYTRMDLMTKTNQILEQNGLEKYSYFFYRQFC